MKGWKNSDWEGDIDYRRSSIGYYFILGFGAILWSRSRKNPMVALSSTKTKYRVACVGTCEVGWLCWFLVLLSILVICVITLAYSLCFKHLFWY